MNYAQNLKGSEEMNEFIKATLIRAIRTMCQTAVATIGTAAVLSDINWIYVISASVLSGIISVLTSIGTGLPEVKSADELTVDEVDSGDDEVSGYDRVGDKSDVE